jgi:NTP pyrophosphatase (non-canonical NTP hydrolase)
MQFHTPKNLAMALSVEVAELSEIFQWLTAEQAAQVMADDKKAAAVRDELADVMIYLTRIAAILGVDLIGESFAKVERNELRFPSNPR